MNDKVKEMMNKAEGNFAIFDSIAKAYSVLPRYENITCSISGGRDSDIVMDLIHTLDTREREYGIYGLTLVLNIKLQKTI